MASYADQAASTIRFDWGPEGLRALAQDVPSVVVIDVLSFTTCVSVAVDREAEVLPYPFKGPDAAAYAKNKGAVLAGSRNDSGLPYSLSPASLLAIDPGTRLVLPSPNGSELAFAAPATSTVIAGCLRNCKAVAAYLRDRGGPVALIAAGERWPDGSLRPCIEDLLGAGAIAALIGGQPSPEADVAAAAYTALEPRIAQVLESCSSGRELIEEGFPKDVELASEMNASDSVPILTNEAFTIEKG